MDERRGIFGDFDIDSRLKKLYTAVFFIALMLVVMAFMLTAGAEPQFFSEEAISNVVKISDAFAWSVVILAVLGAVIGKIYIKIKQKKVSNVSKTSLKKAHFKVWAVYKIMQILSVYLILVSVYLCVIFAFADISFWYIPVGVYAMCSGALYFNTPFTLWEINQQGPLDGIHAKEELVPTLYSLARKAARKMGKLGKVKIRLNGAGGISIVKLLGMYFVTVDIDSASLMTKEEIYASFLHEFAHYKKECGPRHVFERYTTRLALNKNEKSFNFLGAPFKLLRILFSSYYVLLRMGYSKEAELNADKLSAKYSSAEANISGVAKLTMSSTVYEFEWFLHNPEENPYKSEKPVENYIMGRYKKVLKAAKENRKRWKSIVDASVSEAFETHPSLKERAEYLKVTDYKIVFPDETEDAAFYEELLSGMRFADSAYAKAVESHYREQRTKKYLEPMRIIEYNQDKRSDPESASKLIDAYAALDMFDKALALCDELIEAYGDDISYAYWSKGLLLLHKYDDEGIEHILHSMSIDPDRIRQGKDELRSYFYYTGRTEKLDEYEETIKKFNDIAARNMEIGAIDETDKLFEATLTLEERERIKAFIGSVDRNSLERVYIVAKQLTNGDVVNLLIPKFTNSVLEVAVHKTVEAMKKHIKTEPFGSEISLVPCRCEPLIEEVANCILYVHENKRR